jgi:hypothetical protein
MSALFAYLDPGSGSLLLQVVLGGSAAFMVGVRLCWRYVCSYFRRAPQPEPSEPSA